MIISIAGSAGAGKSTVAKLVAEKLKFTHHSIGDFMREIAEKRGETLLEVSKSAEESLDIDKQLDDMQIELSKFENHIVLDSRLGWHFIPKSYKVFLKCDDKVAAQRIFTNKRKEENENATVEATLENIKARKDSEIKRYEEYYKINPYDDKNYDLVLDTTNDTIEGVADKIVEAFQKTQQ